MGWFEDVKKKAKSALGSTGTAIANTAIKATTAGSLSVDGSGWAEKVANGEQITALDAINLAPGAATAGELVKATTPDMPAMPAFDQAASEAAAKAAAETKFKKEAGVKSGLASTILGGSVSNDPNILKKKKLLGE